MTALRPPAPLTLEQRTLTKWYVICDADIFFFFSDSRLPRFKSGRQSLILFHMAFFLNMSQAEASKWSLYRYTDNFNWLVSWYFEPCQPQRITSRPKTTFNLSPVYTARKSSNHKLSKIHKISPGTNPRKAKRCINITQNFRRISPFRIAQLKKHMRIGHAGIVDHFVDNYVWACTRICLSPVFQCYDDKIWFATQHFLNKNTLEKKKWVQIQTEVSGWNSYRIDAFQKSKISLQTVELWLECVMPVLDIVKVNAFCE